MSAAEPSLIQIPPPSLAMLSLIVQFVSAIEASQIQIPPPTSRVFPLIVQSVSVGEE